MATKINNTNQDLTYLDAVRSIEGRGRLPTNLELDEIINNPANNTEFERLRSAGYFRAWSSTTAAHRAPGVAFEKNDLIHPYKDNNGRTYILPAKYIPKQAVGKSGIALVFNNPILEEKGDKVFIHPEKIIVQSFPDHDGWYEVNPQTGIPINKPSSSSNKDARYLWRWSEDSLRPVSRGGDYFYAYFGDYFRRYVFCYGRFDYRLGVGWVQTPFAKSGSSEKQKNECKHMELRKQKSGEYKCKKCREVLEVE